MARDIHFIIHFLTTLYLSPVEVVCSTPLVTLKGDQGSDGVRVWRKFPFSPQLKLALNNWKVLFGKVTMSIITEPRNSLTTGEMCDGSWGKVLPVFWELRALVVCRAHAPIQCASGSPSPLTVPFADITALFWELTWESTAQVGIEGCSFFSLLLGQ